VNLRRGVRALVVDEHERVALVRFDYPDRTVWATPGGGVEDGESEHDALRRELSEELGLEVTETFGEHVWVRVHTFPMTRWDGQTERFYLLRVPAFEIRPALGWSALGREGVGEIRWWTLDEIHAATGVIFAPARLARFLERLLRDGPPPEPVDVGV
jgi:ADP-ribose pyrophosphatase YjhB (NUDIX family)